MKNLLKIFFFFLLLVFFAACHTPLNSVDTNWVQKRKYTKGYYFLPLSGKTKLIQKSNSTYCSNYIAKDQIYKSKENPVNEYEIPENFCKSQNQISYKNNSKNQKTEIASNKDNSINIVCKINPPVPKDTILPKAHKSSLETQKKLNTFAVIAFVLSLLATFPFIMSFVLVLDMVSPIIYGGFLMLFIPAIVFGYIAEHQIKYHPNKGKGHFFSMFAIILGFLIFSLWILIVLLFIILFSLI